MAQAIQLNDYGYRDDRMGLLGRLRATLGDYRAYLATFDELSALSDRELDDIGLARGTIADVARASVYGN